MNQPAPAKKGGSLVLRVIGSCFGLGVADALGSIGYGGAVLGVVASTATSRTFTRSSTRTTRNASRAG